MLLTYTRELQNNWLSMVCTCQPLPPGHNAWESIIYRSSYFSYCYYYCPPYNRLIIIGAVRLCATSITWIAGRTLKGRLSEFFLSNVHKEIVWFKPILNYSTVFINSFLSLSRIITDRIVNWIDGRSKGANKSGATLPINLFSFGSQGKFYFACVL